MTHAFFADMGGFLLESPGTELFPIDAKQLFNLVKEGFIACPDLDAKDIKDKSKSDRLSRCVMLYFSLVRVEWFEVWLFCRMIAILQALWFLINCIGRGAQHLSLTTLELTTISFTIIFLVTSFCWQHKPKDVSRAIILRTDASVDMIRERWNIGPEQKWYQTPLEFLSRKEYYCSLMWRYYVQILHYMHIPLFRRPESRPYDRIPSDTFLDVDKLVEVIGGPSILLFSCMFIFAWSFDFPTPTERLLWRIAALYQVFFGTVGGIFSWYAHNYTLPKLQRGKQSDNDMATLPVPVVEHRPEKGKGRLHRLAWQLRNIHPDRDPYLEVPLKVLLPNVLFSALYSFSRVYLITEDFIGLRSLPESAFQTVDWSNYIPHW